MKLKAHIISYIEQFLLTGHLLLRYIGKKVSTGKPRNWHNPNWNNLQMGHVF